MRYEDIPKRVRNAIEARLNSTVKTYGYTNFRTIATRYMNTVRNKSKLEEEIEAREKELQELKER